MKKNLGYDALEIKQKSKTPKRRRKKTGKIQLYKSKRDYEEK